MKIFRRRMTFDQYKCLPHRLGWKHEYYGGRAVLTPSHVAIASYRLDLGRRPPIRPEVRAARRSDRRALLRLFVDSFREVAEYAGYPRASYLNSARKAINGWYAEAPGNPWRKAASVAEVGGVIIAAALVWPDRSLPLLQPLFVHPTYQRQGWGTAVVDRLVGVLTDLGAATLTSKCHLGNRWSLAWHAKYGFREIPDLYVANARYQHYAWELDRYQRMADPPAEIIGLVRQLADYWRAEATRLDREWRDAIRAAHEPRRD